MSRAEVPEINDLPTAVLTGVGQETRVWIHSTNERNGRPDRRAAHDMIRDVIEDVFASQGVPNNQDLEKLCVLVARTTIGKLVTSQGFDVEFGPYGEPHKIVQVELRPQETIVEQAEVTSTEL